ncbi:hypothetical protein ACGILN_17750 [Serratia marcescens]
MSSRKELANAIRALSMDAVQKANSGHPCFLLADPAACQSLFPVSGGAL